MKWFIGFLGGFISRILSFFVKKFGYQVVLFTLQKSVQIIVIAILLAFFTYTLAYILQIWNTFSSLINDLNNIGNNVGSGSAYGITLSQIMQNARGFIYSSGLSDALVTSGNLLISIFSLIAIKYLYKVYLYLVIKLNDLFDQGLNLLSGSIRL